MPEKFQQKKKSELAYLMASKALPQEGLVPKRRESIYQSIYGERFFSYIEKTKDKKFSRSGDIWVCSTFTKGIYDAMRLNSIYGEITNNVSDSQYKELIKIAPNVCGAAIILPQNTLDAMIDGVRLELPGQISGFARRMRKFSTGAAFSSNGKEYAAQLVSSGDGTYLALGEAGKWNENYPEGTYTLSSIKGKEGGVQKYIQIKINDENLAQNQLKRIYDVIINSKGKKEFLALGYENSLLLNYRHAAFYKSVYRLSNKMQINDAFLEVEGSALIPELRKFFANEIGRAHV